jgi:hypothetical protein
MMIQWLGLVEGVPAMPQNAAAPDAETFLRALFLRVCQIDVGQCNPGMETQDDTHRTVQGHCGRQETGFRWTRTTQMEDSTTDHMLIDTYGLPGIELRWSYLLYKSGYDYRFSHLRLQVAFINDLVQAQFNQCWLDTFALPPIFQAEHVGEDAQ